MLNTFASKSLWSIRVHLRRFKKLKTRPRKSMTKLISRPRKPPIRSSRRLSKELSAPMLRRKVTRQKGLRKMKCQPLVHVQVLMASTLGSE